MNYHNMFLSQMLSNQFVFLVIEQIIYISLKFIKILKLVHLS